MITTTDVRDKVREIFGDLSDTIYSPVSHSVTIRIYYGATDTAFYLLDRFCQWWESNRGRSNLAVGWEWVH